MLIVKRPFKSLGKVYLAGSVITEPANIKRLKGKIAEGKIIEVTEQTYDVTAKYFKEKYGVDIRAVNEVTDDKAEETKDTDEVKVTESPIEKLFEEVPVKKPVVKASVVK